ncbi:MAG: stage II sporulation protein E (SpoIIE) [Betaproteobacteria bacterium HGW-Betaproteobacteria-12]|nr:MAG: stage II sporulation protein E (SpoIIE) [Betaproteobacteria bacterium HGW-Betaproteobacteria-12]
MPVTTEYEYAVAGRPLRGELQSGDAALVQAVDGGVLIAVVDGLGHGDEAAAAAKAAIAVLREHAGEPLAALVQRCHGRLQLTRGVAMVLAAVDAATGQLHWIGVGNVEAVLCAARQGPPRNKLWLTNRSGVVGYRLPAVATRSTPIFPGDLLVVATDGIDEGFASEAGGDGPPGALARAILERHGKASDDALVLVLRWAGAGGPAGRLS